MAKYTKEEYATAKRQKAELLQLMLKKTGTSRQTLIDYIEQEFIVSNLDVLTAAEKKQFDKLVLTK
ncbi:hypothetical protein FACS189440_16570 [Bacteroidia bacterium]|nr:hypothetical protein FACS189440_16570 [Bacteroidia bacterium]